MLKFKLIAMIDGMYHYEIYPEGKEGDPQTFIFNPITKKVQENTFDDLNMKYLGHFLQSVKDNDGNYKNEGMAAWG